MRNFLFIILCAISNVMMAQEKYEYRYWFDSSDKTSLKGTSNGSEFHIEVDTSPLETGLHTFNYQIINAISGESTIKTSFFYKASSYLNKNSIVLVDGLPYAEYNISEKEPSGIWIDIDANTLSLGIHSLDIQLIDDSGISSSAFESFFMKVPTTKDIEAMNVYCIVDNDTVRKNTCTFIDGVAHAEVDMSSLHDGIHTITFFMGNDKGLTTQTNSAYFIKEPLGGNGIKSYRYWINDNVMDAVEKVYDMQQNKIQIIDLIDMPHYALQSSNFYFSIENENPVIYAKNTFNLQVQDASNRFSSSHSDYVDMTIRNVIDQTDIRTITSGNRENIDALTDNNISWYKFTGKDGDSISVKTNRACSIDVFAPNGDVIQKLHGYESTNPCGTFLDMDGTYYIAIHDATSYNKNIDVDFYQIAKYAVVEYDVHSSGNGGFTTITFRGNGYYSLENVSLTKGNDTIPCVDIDRQSNTMMTATFDFGGATTGKYDFAFNFFDETLSIKNGVKVEKETPITLASRVDYESGFYIGHEPYYNITITNNGNNTAYAVPVYIYVETKTEDGMPRIRVSGVKKSSFFEGVVMEDFTEEQQRTLNSLATQIGDNLNFIRIKGQSEETGDSILVSSGYFFVDVPPLSSKKINVSIAAKDTVKCYTTVPDNWTPFTENQAVAYNAKSLYARNSAGNYFCCYHDRVECVLEVATNIADIASYFPNIKIPADIAGCVTSLISTASSSAAGIFCSEDAAEGEKNLYDKLMAVSGTISIAGAVKNCILRSLDKFEKLSDAIDCITKLNDYSFGHVNTTVNCIKSFFSKKPGCPPPPPDGGSSIPINSYDPNDIIGYIAQSGSHYIGIDKKRIHYMVEFENDSTLATAPAHRIILSDKLDPRKFNIESIHTSKIRINNHDIDIDKDGEFVSTIDMRPAINALAQIRLSTNKETGDVLYEFTSLDPMSLEPTYDIMSGILPINNSTHDGEGSVSFDIALNEGLDDGSVIDNSAVITFDSNAPINTPIWHNETDYVRPVSYVSKIEAIDESHIKLDFDGIDNRSGIWKYDLYYQLGAGSDWFLVEEDIKQNSYSLEVYQDINYGFCVIAKDMAENRELKEMSRESSYINGQITTAITEASINDIKSKKIYDLQGRRVRGKLIPGIYIIKGQKILVR